MRILPLIASRIVSTFTFLGSPFLPPLGKLFGQPLNHMALIVVLMASRCFSVLYGCQWPDRSYISPSGATCPSRRSCSRSRGKQSVPLKADVKPARLLEVDPPAPIKPAVLVKAWFLPL